MEPQAQISYLALDIGGSLIKLVYFSQNCTDAGNEGGHVLEGKLEFAKFENAKIHDCIRFIQSKQLKLTGTFAYLWFEKIFQAASIMVLLPLRSALYIKATGGGSYKFADLFKEELGIYLGKEDEMDSLVAGANFLLKSVRDEAFTYMDGQKEFQQIDQNVLYPYLLVNIGSGVSMLKVDGPGKFKLLGGTNVGGATFWGLGRLLTKCKSFDELVELSNRGDNRVMDMLVGDVYGSIDYQKISVSTVSSTVVASRFGKAISDSKELEDYQPEDISRSLLTMISDNIGHISFLNALRFGIKHIFFAGYFLRGHASAMDSITEAVRFWSEGEAKAMFLRHDGFVGALGAFMSYEKHGFDSLMVHQSEQQSPIGSSHGGDKTHGPSDPEYNPRINCSVYLS